MACPICEKRKPARFCPAKGESICAICCGSGREVTIDCTPDCPHLAAAHRYEDEHPRQFPPDTPLLDVRVASDIAHTQQQLMSAVAHRIATFCASDTSATDPDVLAAVQALAETYRTLASGVYYERPPDGRSSLELYRALAAFLEELKAEVARRKGLSGWKDSDVFQLLVVVYRYALLNSNGRPRSRRFIQLLRGQFPDSPELQRSESRIIVP